MTAKRVFCFSDTRPTPGPQCNGGSARAPGPQWGSEAPGPQWGGRVRDSNGGGRAPGPPPLDPPLPSNISGDAIICVLCLWKKTFIYTLS